MKKQQKQKAPKQQKPWQEVVKDYPVALFHTTLGPIIGRVDKAPADHGQFRVRLWAPAVIQVGFVPPTEAQAKAGDMSTLQQRIVFQPIALIESYLDLSVATPVGKSPVPDAVLVSYEEYFAKFASGNYLLRRVVAKIEQDMPLVVDEKPAAPEDKPSSEPGSESDESHVS